VGILPSLAHNEHLGGELFHLLVLSLATPVAAFALLQGYRKHGSSRPAVFGTAALVILWSVFGLEEAINHDLVAAFNVMGGLMMAYAHWQNWNLTKSDCRCSG
jgi:MerC mercury resistance protein